MAARDFSNSTALLRNHFRLCSTLARVPSLSPPAYNASYSASWVFITSSMMTRLQQKKHHHDPIDHTNNLNLLLHFGVQYWYNKTSFSKFFGRCKFSCIWSMECNIEIFQDLFFQIFSNLINLNSCCYQ